jgi:hypothetical protein
LIGVALPALDLVGAVVLVQTEPGYHLAADQHDPIAVGIEIGLAAALLFVGGKLVAQRTFRSKD